MSFLLKVTDSDHRESCDLCDEECNTLFLAVTKQEVSITANANARIYPALGLCAECKPKNELVSIYTDKYEVVHAFKFFSIELDEAEKALDILGAQYIIIYDDLTGLRDISLTMDWEEFKLLAAFSKKNQLKGN